MTPLPMVMEMRFFADGEKKTMYQFAERASASMGPSVVCARRTTTASGCHACARLSAAAYAVEIDHLLRADFFGFARFRSRLGRAQRLALRARA